MLNFLDSLCNIMKIIEVNNEKQQKLFADFPTWLYKSNNFYTALQNQFADVKKRSLPYKAFLVVSPEPLFPNHKKIVGRIAVCLNKATKEAFFANIDFIDNHDVAEKLTSEAESFAIENGMQFLRGPMSWDSASNNHGLLAEGFDRLTPPPYNYAYYRNRLEELGFEKDSTIETNPNRQCYFKKLS